MAAIGGRVMHSAAMNSGTPSTSANAGKPSHNGSITRPATPAKGTDRTMPRRKFSPAPAGLSRLANRLSTTPVMDTAPRPLGQAVASQKADTQRNARALRKP